MCGRYVLKREDLEAMVKQVGLTVGEAYASRYNIAPTTNVPAVRRRANGAPELAALRWGLVRRSAAAEARPQPVVNIRAETLGARLKSGGVTRRCVLPASGFFEWQAIGARKQPWYFSAADGGPVGLAGIWDLWRAPDGFEIETCAILTTEPNELMRPIHTRMPVVLTPAQTRAWVAETDSATLQALLAPAPAAALTAIRVGPAVSNVKNDNPDCIAPAPDEPPPPAEPQLSLGL